MTDLTRKYQYDRPYEALSFKKKKHLALSTEKA